MPTQAWRNSRSKLLKVTKEAVLGLNQGFVVSSPRDEDLHTMFGQGATDEEILSKFSGLDPSNLSRKRSRYNEMLRAANRSRR